MTKTRTLEGGWNGPRVGGRALVTTGGEIEELKAKADAVHIAALNLSDTLGVFHGINNSLEAGALGGPVIRAINVIQSDWIHLLVIRVCALCASAQNRPDDASIQGLVNALQDKGTREKLIEADEQWRAAIGARAAMCADVRRSIGMLKRRWSVISSQPERLERLHRFRNKRLGHVTVANKPNQEAQLIELWKTGRNALSAARQIRLVFHREDFNYLRSSARAEVVGRKLGPSSLDPRSEGSALLSENKTLRYLALAPIDRAERRASSRVRACIVEASASRRASSLLLECCRQYSFGL